MLLVDEVLAELKALRKRHKGSSSEALAGCPAITSALGNGDPVAAFAALVAGARLHNMDHGLAAALASLGIGATGDSALDRLQHFADQAAVDQRTARRWADDGLPRLARLISTNWSKSVPTIHAAVQSDGHMALLVSLKFEKPDRVRMQDPRIEVLHDDDPPDPIDVTYLQIADPSPGWQAFILPGALALNLAAGSSTIRVEWAGELWPQHVVSFATPERVQVRALGNLLHLHSPGRTADAVPHVD